MKSKTSLVARQYRLQQWADQIRECQSRFQDMIIKEWCSQHELTIANYYYLEKMLYLASQNVIQKWKMRYRNWDLVLSQLTGLQDTITG